jgi:beta-glucanase (GH16 family)
MNLVRVVEGDRKAMYESVAWDAPGTHSYGRTTKGDFTAWHTYTVEWRATFVKMYLDDQLVYDSAASATPVVIPKVPMHLFIQQTPGPTANDVPAPGASTPAQVVMHVDWARMYA